MKRKIPARKHHGIRDPIKQNEQRLAKIKDKINAPPDKNQHISYKLAQFMKLKNDVKSGNFKKLKKTINNEDKPKKFRQEIGNKIKPIRKLPNESDEDYLKRVNRITTESLKESQYELKYGVNVIHDSKTGEIKIQKRPKNEIDEILEKNKNKKNTIKKTSLSAKSKIDPKTAKELIKQVLKEEKDKKSTEKLVEYKRDVIQFGETVHAPPSLTLPRKAQKDETVPRPGKKNNLLLKNLLNNDEDSETNESKVKISKTDSKSSTTIDLKGKRKDLPVATRRMIEHQQSKAIEMYRQLKKNKMNM